MEAKRTRRFLLPVDLALWESKAKQKKNKKKQEVGMSELKQSARRGRIASRRWDTRRVGRSCTHPHKGDERGDTISNPRERERKETNFHTLALSLPLFTLYFSPPLDLTPPPPKVYYFCYFHPQKCPYRQLPSACCQKKKKKWGNTLYKYYMLTKNNYYK